jgi:hypothetical protein
MRLAAEQPWNDIEIGDISREAGVSLAEFRECGGAPACRGPSRRGGASARRTAARGSARRRGRRFMLASAGISTEGPLGRVKLQGVVIAFARVTEVWLATWLRAASDSGSPRSAKTMRRSAGL